MEGACLGRSSIDDKQVVIHSGLRSPSELSVCLPACLPACLPVGRYMYWSGKHAVLQCTCTC